MGRWSFRTLSPTTWFFVACSCCTGVFYEREAHKRAKYIRNNADSVRSVSESRSYNKDLEYNYGGIGYQDDVETITQQSVYGRSLGNKSPMSQIAQREFVSSHLTMWMDSSIPLETLEVNVRARILLICLNIIGWVHPLVFYAFLLYRRHCPS